MFGQRDSHKDDKAQGAPAVPQGGTLPSGNGIPDDHAVTQMLTDSGAPTISHAPANNFMPFGGTPLDAPQPAPVASGSPYGSMPIQSAPAPMPMQSAPAPLPTPMPQPQEPVTMIETNGDELLTMKAEALQHLQPLVSTLQQSPEDEFRTLMMMIQATDDKSLLKKALDAAKRIGDDKVRAQAMLDVINEINYFTQTSGEED